MRARGDIQALMIAVLAGVALALVAFLVGDWRGHTRGLADKQAEWDRQKLVDVAAGQARDRGVLRAIDNAQDQAAGAEKVAAENERKWKEAKRETHRNRVALGSCVADGQPAKSVRVVKPGPDGLQPPASAGGDRADAPVVRLNWRFVGMHDAAFTAGDGKPVFQDSSDFALDPGRADTASPYGLDELLEVHGENARALSSCRRAYGQALGELDAAAAAWERQR